MQIHTENNERMMGMTIYSSTTVARLFWMSASDRLGGRIVRNVISRIAIS